MKTMNLAQAFALIASFTLLWCIPDHAFASSPKSTLLVLLDDKPSWRDMVFLAAVPASEVVNQTGGSLIALEPNDGIGPEIQDYMRRYKPDAVYLIGSPEPPAVPIKLPDSPAARLTTLSAASAEDAALHLSRTFWKNCKSVVVCRDDDYPSALVAVPLAAKLKAPLL